MYAFRSSRSDLSPEGSSVRPSASRALFSVRASSMIVSRWLRCRTGAMVGTPKDDGNWSAVRSARASVSPLAAGSSQVFLSLAEGHSLSFQPSLLVGRNGGVEPSGDVPADGATQDAALADALRRAAAAPAGRVVEALEQGHTRSLRSALAE